MKLIVGLGNPGKKYEKTRHNVGFLVLDELKNQISQNGSSKDFKFQKKFKSEVFRVNDLILVKPQTFMNDSGEAVSSLFNFYKISGEDLFVAHDDLDLKLGEYKIQFSVGPELHKGILSIDKLLGTDKYWRVRLGVDNRTTNSSQKIPGEDYVLQDFNAKERKIIDKAIIDVVSKLSEKLKRG